MKILARPYSLLLLLLLTLALRVAAPDQAIAREMGEPTLDGDEFTKRFTASYGIMSEREPPLSDIEVAILKKMAPMMRVNREYAQTLLQSLTVAETKSSASFNYLLGNIYFENEEYILAEEQYKRAIERFPDFQRAWTNLGVLKLRSNDTRSALIAFLRAIELGDQDAHTFGMLGYCHYKEGNFNSAEVAYNRAMLAQPNNLEWLEGKAQVYYESGRYLEAIRAQDELIARRPNSYEYWMAQTNSYLASNDLTRTARNLEIVRSLGKVEFQQLFLLGSLYAKMKLTGPAADAYLEAAEIASPEQAPKLAMAARQLLNQEQVEAARAIFERVRAGQAQLDDPDRLEIALLAGDFATLDGKSEEAIAAYEEAERIDPMAGLPLIKLAQTHAKAGNLDKAFLLLDRAENDPESEYDALIVRVKLLIAEERFAESQTYVSRALKLQSSEAIQTLYEQVKQAAQDRG